MNLITIKSTVTSADEIIDFCNAELGQRSYTQAQDGFIRVPLEKFGIISLDIRRLVIKFFSGDYEDVDIVLENGTNVLKIKNPFQV